MRKRNVSIIIVIFCIIIMAIVSVLIYRDATAKLGHINFYVARMLSIHFTVLILCMAAISVSAISQLIRIYERKPDMYKYDMPLAIMNEYAGLLRLQQEKNAAYGAMLQALMPIRRSI